MEASLGNPAGLRIPRDKLISFEASIEENNIKQKFISTTMKAKSLEMSIRKLFQDFYDKNREDAKEHLRNTNSTRDETDPVKFLKQSFAILLSESGTNNYSKLTKLREKALKLRSQLIVHYGGHDQVRALEENLTTFLDVGCQIPPV